MRIARLGFVAVLWGCQTAQFEPVPPGTVADTTQSVTVEGQPLSPNVMLVVDKSGSMSKPIDASNPACPTSCGLAGNAPCPAGCPTRISELQAAMDTFLGRFGTQVRVGLIALPKPSGQACDPSGLGDVLVSLPAAAAPDDPTAAAQVDAAIQALVPSGGTPTAATLAALAGYAPLQDANRDNYVLLLTDGEPNCNAGNPNDCTQTACQCTFYAGASPAPGSCPGPACACGVSTANPACTLGCSDVDAVVQAIQALLGEGVRTIPVGFGTETIAGGTGTGYAPIALNEMAAAGGMARSCPGGTDAECSSPGLADTCDLAGGKQCGGGTSYCCSRKYYAALDGQTLDQILRIICVAGLCAPSCTYELEATPRDPATLAVLVNGEDVPSNGGVNWIYLAPSAQNLLPTVQFPKSGAYCQRIVSATRTNPVKIEFRIAQAL